MSRKNSNSGQRLSRGVLGVATLVLMGLVGVSYHEWRQYSHANADAALAREIVDSVDTLLASLTDAEAGQRGFLLTGEDGYLEPYNRAVQAIPGNLAQLKSLLAARSGQSANMARMDGLVNEKLAELQQTIELRRTQGAQAALAIVLSHQGKRLMDEIRALGAEIRRRENSGQIQTSTAGEAAAQTALLVTVAGSIVLLFLFAFGLEPFASTDPQAKQRSRPLRYGAAVLAVVVTVLFRMALTPLMGPTAMPFTLFFPAVWFAAWFGGFRAGSLSVALSALAGAYFFAEPTRSLLVSRRDDQVAVLMLVMVGFGMALLSNSQQRAVERAKRAEDAERIERKRFETTLASIGDAVIVTDREGRVTFANKVVLSLLRAPESDVLGRHLDEVFCIVNEFTRAKVESPVTKVLREGDIVGLANHTVLVAQDGTEVPIDDSGAPVRSESGTIQGTVLVFRDVTERRAAEKLLAAQSAELRQKAELMERAQLCVRDLDDRIIYWNRGAAELYGFSTEEAVGQISHSLLMTEFPAPLDEIRAQLMSTGEWHGELVYTKRNGDRITVASHWALHRDDSGRPVAILEVSADMTERKRLERELREAQSGLERTVEERTVALQLEIAERKSIELRLRESEQSLRQLSVRLMSTQDEERRRIARELHDSVGQYLAHARLILESFLQKPDPTEKGMQVLSQMAESLDSCLTETRTLTHLLHPPLLDQLGFGFAAKSYADGFSQRSGIQVNLNIPGELKRLPSSMELVLFRILQESLTNVLRHAQSRSVDIQVEMDNANVILAVKDYGKGISPELLQRLQSTGQGGGVGLSGMRERIVQFDGRFEIQSDERGTLVRAILPFSGNHPGSQSGPARY